MTESSHFLYLNQNVIRFEPVPDPLQSSTSVFYDEGNSQIFVVKNKGLDGITVKGPDAGNEVTFTLPEANDIHSIKFSPSCSILAIHRSFNSVHFVNFNNNQPGKEYSQMCKAKNSRILGICWTGTCEIVVVTDSSVEFWRVNSIKRSIRPLRLYSIIMNWFIFNYQTNFLLAAMGNSSTVMQGIQFTTGSVLKLSKFEVELNSTRARAGSLPERRRVLQERDVCLTTLYGQLRLLVFRQDPSFIDSSNSPGNYNCGAQIAIYSFVKDATPRITHILELELTGRFAINIIDNLVIFHHQTSQTSLIFDIRSKLSSVHGNVPHLKTLIPPFTIKKFSLPDVQSIEMYSHKWAVFHPNIIIDASIGCLWRLELDLDAICNIMTQSATLVDFLILRRNSKNLLVRISKEAFLGQLWSSNGRILGTISELFTKLNQAWKSNHLSKSEVSGKNKESMHEQTLTTLDQSEMCDLVFPLLQPTESNIPSEFGASVILEYIHSLNSNGICIEYSTYEHLVKYLIECNMVNHLQQFLQFHVFEDSKQLASLLLKYRHKVKNAPQLALDMLKRLNIPAEEMIDVLLSLDPPANVLRALRYASTPQQAFDAISSRKFLQVAKDTNDELFYTVFKLFEQRNLRTRGCIDFSPGEQCDHLVAYYKSRFTEEILYQDHKKVDRNNDQVDLTATCGSATFLQ